MLFRARSASRAGAPPWHIACAALLSWVACATCAGLTTPPNMGPLVGIAHPPAGGLTPAGGFSASIDVLITNTTGDTLILPKCSGELSYRVEQFQHDAWLAVFVPACAAIEQAPLQLLPGEARTFTLHAIGLPQPGWPHWEVSTLDGQFRVVLIGRLPERELPDDALTSASFTIIPN